MKKFILLLLLFVFLFGFSSDVNPFWGDDGNLKDEYVIAMQKEWCEHNKGRDFTINRCE